MKVLATFVAVLTNQLGSGVRLPAPWGTLGPDTHASYTIFFLSQISMWGIGASIEERMVEWTQVWTGNTRMGNKSIWADSEIDGSLFPYFRIREKAVCKRPDAVIFAGI